MIFDIFNLNLFLLFLEISVNQTSYQQRISSGYTEFDLTASTQYTVGQTYTILITFVTTSIKAQLNSISMNVAGNCSTCNAVLTCSKFTNGVTCACNLNSCLGPNKQCIVSTIDPSINPCSCVSGYTEDSSGNCVGANEITGLDVLYVNNGETASFKWIFNFQDSAILLLSVNVESSSPVPDIVRKQLNSPVAVNTKNDVYASRTQVTRPLGMNGIIVDISRIVITDENLFTCKVIFADNTADVVNKTRLIVVAQPTEFHSLISSSLNPSLSVDYSYDLFESASISAQPTEFYSLLSSSLNPSSSVDYSYGSFVSSSFSAPTATTLIYSVTSALVTTSTTTVSTTTVSTTTVSTTTVSTTTVSTTTVSTTVPETTTTDDPTKTKETHTTYLLVDNIATPLVQRKILTVLPEIAKEYIVSFDYYPNSFPNTIWYSVIRFTIVPGINWIRYGYHIPGIYLNFEGFLQIACSLNSDGYKYFNTNPIVLKEWINIEVSQILNNTNYVYRIKLNGTSIYSEINNLPQSFKNVTVYASDESWPSDGFIKNLFVANGRVKKCDPEESSLTGFAPCTSPCLKYRVIDDFQRSTAFKVDPNIFIACNKSELNTAWYRFTSGAGGKIPTKNPPPFSCGVKSPMWLNGTEPSLVNETKTIQACAVVDKDSCAEKFDVKVKKCLQNEEEYFVYYLQELSSCSMRYCAGSEKKCNLEENSATGFAPCSSDFPKINQDPVVTVGVKNKRVAFTCKFNTVKDNKARYEVNWYQGLEEKQIQGPEVFTSEQNEVLLYNKNKYGEAGTFCMGHDIHCKVQSYYVGNENVKSRVRKSNKIFAGLQVNPKLLVLSEKDKPLNITIKSTVPIICGDGTENCTVLVEIGQTSTDHFVDYCTLQLKPGPAGQTKEFEVVAKRDFVDDGNQRMFLKISIYNDHVDPIDWNCHKEVTDVEIKTIDVRTSRCTSSGDPHIVTFDQFYYAHLYVGDYVLVQSTTRNFKVHARTFACSQSVSCNCGIAAQEGDDIIVIDMCRDSVPRVRFASSVEPMPGTSISRDTNGKNFVISFPSGASVKFSVFNWRGYFANIEVQVPSDDYQGTQGLCGTFDRNSTNDMMAKDGKIYPIEYWRYAKKEFSESWKLSNSSENLFYFKGGPRKCKATRAKSYCVCSESCCGSKRMVNCDFEGFVDRPKYIHGMIGWKTLQFPGAEHCGRRKRRSMDNNVIVLPDDGDTGVYDYNPSQVSVDVPNFPTKSNITENDAKNVCKENIRNSVVGKACIKVIGPSFTTDRYEQQCVLDIQVTDNTRISIDSAINNLISACEELTLRDLSFWVRSNGNITAPPLEIAESLCPNECNRNGVCKNGTCICNLDFITADCSLKKGQIPVLTGLTSYGLCDIREQDCVRTRVIGKDFIDSSSLSCRMTEVKISEKPHEEIGYSVIEIGQLLSFSEISCLLPTVPVDIMYSSNKPGKPVGGYTISVSNNKINFTANVALLVVYDSKCMGCNTTDKTCKWKDNSCKINEYCFAAGDPNPKEWCEVCNPAESKTSFSKRTNNIPPWFNKNTPKQYVFKGQQWKYVIPAFDPETQPLKYELIGESLGMKISSDGILTWTPAKIGNYYFVVKVTDPCGLSDTAQFKVETMQCYCEGKNDGFCIWKGEPGNYNMSICQCPNGCSGEQCTQPIDGLVCKIRVTNQDNKKLDGFSKTVIAVISVASFLFLAIFVLLFVAHLKKKNKIVFQEKIELTENKSVSKTVGDSPIPLNSLKISNEGNKNEAFVMEDENPIKNRKTAWQT